MHEDDAGGVDGPDEVPTDGQRIAGARADIFGDYRVIGPGVHIVLDGRTVTSPEA